MKKKKTLIEMFERINAVVVPKTSILGESREPRLDPQRMKAPWSSIVDYFKHDKLDVSQMDQDIVRQIFAGWDDYSSYIDGLSDMETNEDGSVSVEFDGMYGKHWQTFPSEEVWHQYYEEKLLPQYREVFNKAYKTLEGNKVKKQQDIDHSETTTNTIGNIISPDVLSKLKGLKERQGDIFEPVSVNPEPYADNQDQFARPDPESNVDMAPIIPESKTIVNKEVRFLKPGDVLSGGLKVIGVSAGLKTPRGKMDVVVEYPNGERYRKTWGKYTVVGVVDSATPALPPDPTKLPDEISNNEQPSLGL